MEIFTAIDIDASPETVWSVLTDFDAYDDWNPRTRITGRAEAGERLVVAPGPDAEGMPTFRPRVLRADEPTELRWLGHLYVRGLFDGEHVFAIEELDDGRTRFTQSERFGGVLVRPLLRLYGDDTEAGFEAVNAALKARAEEIDGRAGDGRPEIRVEGDGHSADTEVPLSG
ncbi:SRPBCC domain-containing protein [Halosimplex litoreum]|uniref:SRPBCC domain-containing protein n=1 Tax=Halosimplex litoreum TaxID=1198301 RepID=A0A7T3G062_9EURY|nr:SRPBCC domain-containing protein [Halosimplex litoreum]QPV63488.1 SRPBCC domain-containing protein [Halosimplex litoreum]